MLLLRFPQLGEGKTKKEILCDDIKAQCVLICFVLLTVYFKNVMFFAFVFGDRIKLKNTLSQAVI